MKTSYPLLLLLVGCGALPPNRPPAVVTDQRMPAARAIDPLVAQMVESAITAHEAHRRVILENLLNVHTIAYKRTESRVAGIQPLAVGDGAVVEAASRLPAFDGTVRIFDNGVLEQTGRGLDVAIDGAGFFGVDLRDGGTGYTRNGTLHIDRRGMLVTSVGDPLSPSITFPQDVLDIAVDAEGRVTGRTGSAPDLTSIFGQLQLCHFTNMDGLRAEGASVWRSSDASGAAKVSTPGQNGLGYLKQGFIERSNVETARELIRLQILERNHEALLEVLRRTLGLIVPGT